MEDFDRSRQLYENNDTYMILSRSSPAGVEDVGAHHDILVQHQHLHCQDEDLHVNGFPKGVGGAG